MKRPAFFSFHYDNDAWRAALVRNIGAVEGSEPVSTNDWEAVKRGGDRAIANWIDAQLKYKQIVIVLIGAQTASRPWVKYEIQRAWALDKPLMGICIDGLANQKGEKSLPGLNPFAGVKMPGTETTLESWVPVHRPWAYGTTKECYNDIRMNLSTWVEDAIQMHNNQEILFGR